MVLLFWCQLTQVLCPIHPGIKMDQEKMSQVVDFAMLGVSAGSFLQYLNHRLKYLLEVT